MLNGAFAQGERLGESAIMLGSQRKVVGDDTQLNANTTSW